MKDKPLVTVGAFNYNNARFIIETLESIKQQTYQYFELIIVDDCSTDNSVELVNNWLKTYDKPYTLVIHEKNKGLKAGLAEAIDQALGKYFSLIATDDVMMPYKLEEQVALMESSSEDVGMVYGDCMMIDENSEIIHKSLFRQFFGENFIPPSGNIFKDVLNEFYFYSQASLINLNLFKKIGFHFDERIISEDWDIEIAIARTNKIYGIKRPYIKYRKVSNSVTSRNWTNERMHLVHESHFIMFYKYIDNPLNTLEENNMLIDKAKGLYWKYFESAHTSYKKRVMYYYKIFKKSKKMLDFLMLIRLASLLKSN